MFLERGTGRAGGSDSGSESRRQLYRLRVRDSGMDVWEIPHGFRHDGRGIPAEGQLGCTWGQMGGT
jgi:hypothetical protein